MSTILIYDICYPSPSLEKIKLGDRIAIWLLTMFFLIYYIKIHSKPQLAPPSVLSNEKDNSRNNHKSSISFKDVAGLEEIKEELQETIDFINNSNKYIKNGSKDS